MYINTSILHLKNANPTYEADVPVRALICRNIDKICSNMLDSRMPIDIMIKYALNSTHNVA